MVVFNSTTLAHQTFHKDKVSIFFFYGRNHGEDVEVIDSTVNCGCTVISHPTIIKGGEPFNVTVSINKTGQSGFVSQTATMTLADGQKFSFNVNGRITE